MKYPKIETLYERDQKTHKVIDKLRRPEFDLVSEWLVTEKIDGTNVRVMLSEEGTVSFGGRTDDAQMPTFLLSRLQGMFPSEKVASAFDPGTKAVLYGEGYGPKIQKGGGNYSPEPSFRLFDVAVIAPERVWWLRWQDVEDVARKLEIRTVPVIYGVCHIEDAIECVRERSRVAAEENDNRAVPMEGIVARTEPMLFDRRGERVMWKLKGKDFA